MDELAAARRRNGGYDWTLMQDAADPSRFLETWFEVSWVEHLRHHERVTGDDQKIQAQILELQCGNARPVVKHVLAANRAPLEETAKSTADERSSANPRRRR